MLHSRNPKNAISFQSDTGKRRNIRMNLNVQIWGLDLVAAAPISAAIPISVGFTRRYPTATMLNRGPAENSCLAASAVGHFFPKP
jgi:hypothetical protein